MNKKAYCLCDGAGGGHQWWVVYECRVAGDGTSSSRRRRMSLLDAGAISVCRQPVCDCPAVGR